MTPAFGQIFVVLVLLVALAAVVFGAFYLIRTLIRINRHIIRNRHDL